MSAAVNQKNLVSVILERQAGKNGIIFIDKPEGHCFVSYRDLYMEALRILYYLQSTGLKPGDEVVFQLQGNFDLLAAFWACLLGSMIPVPITVGDNDEYRRKLFNIWQVLKKPYLITFRKHLETLEGFTVDKNLTGLFESIKLRTITVEDMEGKKGKGTIVMPQETDTTFIQFSSGSTDTPKGVVLSHKNLLTNINGIIKGFGEPENGVDRYFSWMPLTHDMGLIGFHLTPLVAGWDHTLMVTQLFVRYPYLWLKKMSELQSTLTVSPNFGYQYVLKHFDPLKYQGERLSHIRIIVNGAEPISPRLCAEFLKIMAPLGLRKNAIFPAYGLAEASLAVTVTSPHDEIIAVHLDRNSLKCGERIREEDDPRNTNSVSFVVVGSPVQDCSVKIVDDGGKTCQDHVIGEILIKGDNVTSGYYNNKEATRKAVAHGGWLKTGDLGFLRNGHLVITGRAKEIIFANGQNYYPHDMERVAEELEGIEFEKIAVCGIYNPELQSDEIVCFVVFKRSVKEFLYLAAALKNHIMEKMGVEVSRIIPVKKIPKTTSGKLQRFKLKKNFREGYYDDVLKQITQLQNQLMSSKNYLPGSEIKEIITNIWCEVLKLEKGTIKEDDNFFDLGGNSNAALRLKARLQETLAKPIDDAALFKYPTLKKLKDYLSSGDPDKETFTGQKERLQSFSLDRRRTWKRIKHHLTKGDETRKNSGRSGLEIAVIGMSGRFPGAKNIHEFWENIKNGVECISFFSEEELSVSGVGSQLVNDANYVKAKGILEGSEYFDDAFFDYSPPEAEKMDPQTRIIHECSWETLENAGYDPSVYPGLIGVYLGASPNLYWESTSSASSLVRSSVSQQFVDTQLIDKDFMTTRLSYALNLTGPSFSMYTACSTSLVAVDLACQGLLAGRCDMALAGGASIWLPQKSGYLYEDGMLFSRDGHNRTFAKQASGTIFSDGAGIVLLKRLVDAIADKDHIYAVIKGSALNNDGRRKAGYTAPAPEGQAEVIVSALQMAGAEPESIRYVEAHGTATSLGDLIEIDALMLAFDTIKKGYCAIGSVKSNIGHVNAAAGIAGLIKTVFMLKYRQIPPSLHFDRANPRIDFGSSPFYVNTTLQEWENSSYPRRAGVSSFGIGGTNVHVILEEAPQAGIGHSSLVSGEKRKEREYQLILLSAKTQAALDRMTQNLVDHFKKNPGINLADAAYTLQVGRKDFQYRKMAVCYDRDDAVEVLSSPGLGKVYSADSKGKKPVKVFMFPGQGSQYVDMGLGLYRSEPVFREEMDRCFDIFKSIAGYDIKEILYPDSDCRGGSPYPPKDCVGSSGQGDHRGSPLTSDYINQTSITQPVIFMFEYVLAKLLLSWGISPDVMIGYSFGEYAAACISGVLSLEDALKLTVVRGQLMQQMPAGTMLSVPLPMQELKPLLENHPLLSIAIDNGPSTIVSGTSAAIAAFEKKMKEMRYLCTRVSVSHASHSEVMQPILTRFAREVGNVCLNKPQIPYISNLTAKLVDSKDISNPRYWVNHLKDTVRFGDGIRELLKHPDAVFIEVGAGRDLCVLLAAQKDNKPGHRAINLVRHEKEDVPDLYYLLNRVGHLWLYGVDIDWQGFYADEKRYRISLPTYNFEPQYFPVDRPPLNMELGKAQENRQHKKTDIRDWFYIPVWKRSGRPDNGKNFTGTNGIMLFSDELHIGNKIKNRLKQQGYLVFTVRPGSKFTRLNEGEFLINPNRTDDYQALFSELTTSGGLPTAILHLWCVSPTHPPRSNDDSAGEEGVKENLDKGFHSLIALAQALGKQDPASHFQLKVVSNNMQDVIGGELISPEKATLLGPVRAINKEYDNIRCCSIDIVLPEPGSPSEQWLIEQLTEEFKAEIRDKEKVIAFRNSHRWVRTFAPAPMEKSGNLAPGLREKGVYLISGGLGGVGLIMAEHLARSVKAKLILTRRSAFPAREDWDPWLVAHGEDEKTSRLILKIREMESLGAEILVFSADVTDLKQMQMEISRAEQGFGKINGVIHAAGLGDGAMIMRRSREMSEGILAPKVTGTLVLEKVFADSEPDFFVLCSSIASILSLPGQCAYTAANAFLDAFAASQRFKNHINPLSINWDRWQNIGMAVNTGQEYTTLLGEEAETGITAAEGVEVFNRILSDPCSLFSQVVVSITDLMNRIERFEVSGILPGNDIMEEDTPHLTLHKRRELSVDYVEPRHEIEKKLANVWQQFLGIDRVGIHDNFFEMGATSLGIIQVNNRLKKIFAKEIPVVAMYSYPSIALLAGFLNRETPGNDFIGNENHKFEKMDKGQKKLKYLKTKRKIGGKNE